MKTLAKAVSLGCLVVPLLAMSCKDEPIKPDTTGSSRSEAVKATGTATTPATTSAHAPPPRAPRRICDTAPTAQGKAMPTSKLDHLEAAGTPSLGDRIPTGGKWTWVNLWAAWCGPCKEEIPRLKAWEQKLGSLGTPLNVAFVSLDDDERQAKKFLESQPANGLKASWWLEEGKARSGWLSEMKLKNDPQLPVQLLFDPQGALRCVIEGAVDDGDFPQVQGIVTRK